MSSEKLVVITSFPQKGIIHGKSVVGVASYTKNTLLALKRYRDDAQITVLAERLDGKKESYEDEGIKVKRVWKRSSFTTFALIFKEILSLKGSKNILVEFEVAMFGDYLFLLPFPIFLFLLKVFRKKVTIVSHQVITDIEKLSGHINLNSNLKINLLNFFIGIFYRLMIIMSFQVIVFDNVLKKRLGYFGNENKIVVIPHGVEKFKNAISKNDSRNKLRLEQNDFILLYFGYLAWYKGVDLLVKYFNEMKNDESSIKLIIAGGPNPNHLRKKYYQDYIQNIKQDCRNNNIILTGFINEEDIPLYFQASDLAVFPYRTLMSASGPLSIAFSFQKPVIVSKALSGMFETTDLKDALDELGLNKDEMIFETLDEFENKIKQIKTTPALKERLESLSLLMAEKRSWSEIGKLYYETLF